MPTTTLPPYSPLLVDVGEAEARGNVTPLTDAVVVQMLETAVAIKTGSTTLEAAAVKDSGTEERDVVEQPLLSNEVLVVARSAQIRTSGTGYRANSPVQIWLHSDPVLLDVVVTQIDGTFRSVVPLPKGIAMGDHTLRVVVFPVGSSPSREVSAGAAAVKEAAFGIKLLDDATYESVRSGRISIDDVDRSFVRGISSLRPFGTGQASGWIALLMLLMLIAAYTGDAPLIASRRRAPHAVSALIDDSLWVRTLGNRRYALSAAAVVLVISSLAGSDFLPIYPTALGFVALTVIGAVDPLAGFAAFAATLVGAVLGGAAQNSDEWRVALVVAATYVAAPMLASAVVRRFRRVSAMPVALMVGVVVYYVATFTMTRVAGALLQAELSIEASTLVLVTPAAIALVSRWILDQRYEHMHRRELALRRMTITLGLAPLGLALLAFVVLSNVLIDDESLLALLLLGLIVGLRQAQTSNRLPRSPSPSRSRRTGRRLSAKRPPTSRTR